MCRFDRYDNETEIGHTFEGDKLGKSTTMLCCIMCILFKKS